ncbi:2,3,4,5-tetrahydropyridine-2,6-dicarboxylate N-acetyltransferase [Methylobacterium organophilum]|uniref:2,3,4,5-tetrahydropyridine-2,6-dicarboxylate N-acetyltransferase n=2 Tax=Methylobacterium organophilum TaxID=410 RepID=A0ABQ4T592_METOR|nr:2,3,4,5-tetrahydropyridine-2,6-dicarboxylate N-acetyltransferase [Methylobacterium organophilum]
MRPAFEMLKYLLVCVANAIPRFHALDYMRVFLYRLAGLSIDRETRISGPLILEFSFRRPTLRQIAIGRDCFIGYHCRISASKAQVFIGNRCNIGPNVSIDTAGHWFNHELNKRNSYHKPVTISDNVWIGAGCKILPGVSIGENSVIGAGSVVAKDIESNVLAAGVPAKRIKVLEEFAV